MSTLSVFQETVLPILNGSEEEVISWCKNMKLIRSEMICTRCNNMMNWIKHSRCIDKYAWKCNYKACVQYQSRTSIRSGSFFARSKLSLKSWIHVFYLWSSKISEETARNQVQLSNKTMVDCYSFLREICEKYFVIHPVKLGGQGSIVQIDESCFSHKVKYHRGRVPKKAIWVLGMVDVYSKCGYMTVVDDRSSGTLLAEIEKVVVPGTTIHTDEWKGYNGLSNRGYIHKTVNHSLHFVDRTTGVHTQNIESYWNKQKHKIKTVRGVKRDLLISYLYQFMWQDRFNSNPFHFICSHIAEQYNQ